MRYFILIAGPVLILGLIPTSVNNTDGQDNILLTLFVFNSYPNAQKLESAHEEKRVISNWNSVDQDVGQSNSDPPGYYIELAFQHFSMATGQRFLYPVKYADLPHEDRIPFLPSGSRGETSDQLVLSI